jgi:hypothetical protein
MKILAFIILVSTLNLWAQDKEGDLQLPVSDVSNLEREEQREELPPTLDEVEMKQKKQTTKTQPMQKKTKVKSEAPQ